jgi:hypothetical protein
MLRRIVAYTALSCLLGSMLLGCYSRQEVTMAHLLAFHDHEGLAIRRVVTNDGEVLEFSRDYTPVWHANTTTIIGIPVRRSKPSDTNDPPEMVRIPREERALVYVPVSDVRIVYLERLSRARTTLAVVVGTLGVLAVAVAASGGPSCELSSSDLGGTSPTSCPYVYSFDGELYVREGVTYIGAICEALERPDLLRLERLVPVDGEYRVQISNEAEETEFIDEVSLVVVDHEARLELAADMRGTIHTIAGRRPPLSAVDQHGNDWRRWLGARDFLFWEGDPGTMSTTDPAGLRDTLYFTFERPAGAALAKLLVSGGHSAWALGLEGAMLDLWGAEVGQLYEGLRDPDVRARSFGWVQREEMADLGVRLRTPDGWRLADRVSFRSNYSGECIAIVDLESVEGDVFEIALTPPAGMWRINAVTADFSRDVPVQAREVPAGSALGPGGEDLRDAILADDGEYLVQPEAGMSAQLVFPSPEVTPGLERTVFVKMTGYYDIHLDETGPPNMSEIERLQQEPGYAAVFALRHYREEFLGLAELPAE